MNDSQPDEPASDKPDSLSRPADTVYQPAAPLRPPTPEDFIRDLRESDPLRRFRF